LPGQGGETAQELTAPVTLFLVGSSFVIEPWSVTIHGVQLGVGVGVAVAVAVGVAVAVTVVDGVALSMAVDVAVAVAVAVGVGVGPTSAQYLPPVFK
jgi:hypothetical protein